jgi:2-dehydro-3-deoxygluconokinase
MGVHTCQAAMNFVFRHVDGGDSHSRAASRVVRRAMLYAWVMAEIARRNVLDHRARRFDVICAGDALLSAAAFDAPRVAEPGFGVRPRGGAIHAALALARQGLRVGLASVLSDDTTGRALLAKVAASKVDVDGVELARPRPGLVLVKGGARQVVSVRDEEQPISIPEGWSSQVLLLSGMSPVLSHAAALCKAARAARRAGTVVVADVNADWHLWKGRDPKAIRMVLREADVVSCSAQDLFGLNMDVLALRAALRPAAVLLSSDGAGRVSATGLFGEVAHALDRSAAMAALGEGDTFTAAICGELARAGLREDDGALWARVLKRAQAVGMAQARR